VKVGQKGDRALWRLQEPFINKTELMEPWLKSDPLIVPAGFLTDLASVPRAVLSITGETAQEAAIPHDYLYQFHHLFTVPIDLERRIVDLIFHEAMGRYGPTDWRRAVMYEAVHRFGFIPWSSNRERVVALNPQLVRDTDFA
jgi:hypothetical protein